MSGRIITIKNNKGGVGKTFITAQLAHGLSLLEKKVLILTSDSQNNIFNYLLKGNKDFENGLKAEISKRKGEYFRLRENLYFLPLENSSFGSQFIKEIPNYLERMKKEYDYILIDSIPTLKIDNIFLENSDYIIIPAFCDEVTIEGILNLIGEIGKEKILSIVVNKFKSTEIQNYFLEQLKGVLENTTILFPDPIKQLSFIEKMLYNKKTIWEYSNKEATQVQESFYEIIKNIEMKNN
ncbi:MAG: ParA family protein [Cetobacterium sp.]|nr:ParA family protein [Cetobacterium sp.]